MIARHAAIEEGHEQWKERVQRELERERQFPGIEFRWGPSDRVVYIRGTGIKVWIVARTFRDAGGELLDLARTFHWLTWDQLRAALDYYEAFAEEIDARITEDENASLERLWAEYPQTKPPWR